MIEKTYLEKDGVLVAQVKFSVPGSIWANDLHLVGDFNDWDRTSHPLELDREGNWTITLDLPCGKGYQFRYLCDEQCWFSDNQPDAYVNNQYGSQNCVLITDPSFKPYSD